MEAGALFGMEIVLANPLGCHPHAEVLISAHALAEERGGSVDVVADPTAAVSGAQVVYTDVWVSMGEDAERAERVAALHDYQVTPELMAHAARDAIFMHCLPAHRGEEVAAAVIDGPRSVVFQQAANRLPTEQALIHSLIHGADIVRVVAALGGNALLQRGEPADAPHQRRNVAAAAAALATIAAEHELVVTHGNGPQVGLLALQAEAYADVAPYPLDVLGAESEGMVGYLIEQGLRNRLPGREAATLLTQVVVDRARPGVRGTDQADRTGLRAGRGSPACRRTRLGGRARWTGLATGSRVTGAAPNR